MFVLSFYLSRFSFYIIFTYVYFCAGKQWSRFSVYSALSWLVPAVFSAAALAVQYLDLGPHDFHPGFGRVSCWFSNPKALLVFLLAPTLVVMVLNLMFFCWSAYIVFSTTMNMRSATNSQQDFWLYARLALIMGLTWITGIIGSYIDIEGKILF